MWDRPGMPEILASRDIAALYEKLNHQGFSQRRIAALTGHSQSEISEILAGRRVTSYDVLVRIAEGLGIRRSRLGLGCETGVGARDAPLPEKAKRKSRREPPWWAYETVTGDS